jgi:hypothetical protein
LVKGEKGGKPGVSIPIPCRNNAQAMSINVHLIVALLKLKEK